MGKTLAEGPRVFGTTRFVSNKRGRRPTADRDFLLHSNRSFEKLLFVFARVRRPVRPSIYRGTHAHMHPPKLPVWFGAFVVLVIWTPNQSSAKLKSWVRSVSPCLLKFKERKCCSPRTVMRRDLVTCAPHEPNTLRRTLAYSKVPVIRTTKTLLRGGGAIVINNENLLSTA